jgi:hypothetical protein
MSAFKEKLDEMINQHANDLQALIESKQTICAYDDFCKYNGFTPCITVSFGELFICALATKDYEWSEGQLQSLSETDRLYGKSPVWSLNGFDVVKGD